MYENETYEVILDRMLARVSDTLDKRPSSPIYDTHSATAIELQILYIELETLIHNSYGDTATREFLILLAKDRGLSPKPATHALLKGEFTPTTIDVTGQRFNIGDINYVVRDQICPGQYEVQCEVAGAIGNQYFGDMIPIDYINGLQTSQLTKILIPGEDEEDTEVFRQRYFDSFNEQSFAGNRAAYLKTVRKIDGVGDLKITRVWNGDIRPTEMIPTAKVTTWFNSVVDGLDAEVAAWLSAVYIASYEKKLTVGGTVLVTVVNSLDFGEATNVLLDKIQTELDPVENAGEGYGLAPIGHVVSVKSADGVKINIRTNLDFDTGYGWNNLKNSIEMTVADYLLELRKSWANMLYLTVRVSQIERRLLDIQGIVDVKNTIINGLSSNLVLGKYEIPLFGGISE